MIESLASTILDHKFIPGDMRFGWEKQCAHDAPDGLRQCGYPIEDHLRDQEHIS